MRENDRKLKSTLPKRKEGPSQPLSMAA